MTLPDWVPDRAQNALRERRERRREAHIEHLAQAFAGLDDAFIASEQRERAARNRAHYATYDTLFAYVNHFERIVVSRVPRFRLSHGLDYGCWHGFSTLILRRLGAWRMTGVDVLPEMIDVANGYREQLGLRRVTFARIANAPPGDLPLAAASVDWVLCNDVFSFAHPDGFPHMVAEAARVLRRGGRFILSDENNPHNPDVATRLLRTYRRYEIGAGSEAAPAGPFWAQRRQLLAVAMPDVEPATLDALAAQTAYSFGDALIEQGRALAAGSPAARPRCFDPQRLDVPIHPRSGSSVGAVTDPDVLRGLFEDAGLRTTLRVGEEVLDQQACDERRGTIGRFELEGIKP